MEWIDVTKSLPKVGTDVLVLVKKESKKLKPAKMQVRVGHRLSERDIWIIGDDFGFNFGKVTHWMPLPELPQPPKLSENLSTSEQEV
jgi:hypothetical protein